VIEPVEGWAKENPAREIRRKSVRTGTIWDSGLDFGIDLLLEKHSARYIHISHRPSPVSSGKIAIFSDIPNRREA
jgi:hypothetical protein